MEQEISVDVATLASRVAIAEAESDRAALEARRSADALWQVHQVAGREILRGARLYAHVRLVEHIVEHVQKLVDQARTDGPGVVTAEDLELVLRTPITFLPTGPVSVAYVPDPTGGIGHFRDAAGDLFQAYPFTGWSLVCDEPTPGRDFERTFLVRDKLMSVSRIRGELGLALERFVSP